MKLVKKCREDESGVIVSNKWWLLGSSPRQASKEVAEEDGMNDGTLLVQLT